MKRKGGGEKVGKSKRKEGEGWKENEIGRGSEGGGRKGGGGMEGGGWGRRRG